MPGAISSIQPVTAPALDRIPSAPQTGVAGGSSFREILSGSIAEVESQQSEAQSQVGKLLSGETEDLHTMALASQRAELSLEMFMQVRNKVVSAYQEVMRMQL